jgi:hypothetical protein
MVSAFAACDACSRHVRAQDTLCPFCQTPIAGAARRAAPSLIEGRGLGNMRNHLSRAAILAGAAFAIGTTACSSDDTSPQPLYGGLPPVEEDAGLDAGLAQPVYGAPIEDGGGTSTSPDGGGIAQPAYGAPITSDGGIDKDGGVSQPVYGSPTPQP